MFRKPLNAFQCGAPGCKRTCYQRTDVNQVNDSEFCQFLMYTSGSGSVSNIILEMVRLAVVRENLLQLPLKPTFLRFSPHPLFVSDGQQLCIRRSSQIWKYKQRTEN